MTYSTCTGTIGTGTCVRTYFRQFVVSFIKKFQNYVVFYQEHAPDKKFPEPEPHQNSSETLLVLVSNTTLRAVYKCKYDPKKTCNNK